MGGLFGELLSVYQAKNRKQWQLALKRAGKLIHMQNKCAQKASIYEHMGDWKQALYWQKHTRAVIDSIQSSEARSQMNEFDTELAITYAENEIKEQFGNERLQALLKKDLGDARQTSETIHKAVEEFVGDAEPSDDLTKMCIKMK